METNLRKTALTLDKLLKVAKYVTYGVMVSAIICIFLGYECNIGNLVDIMEAEAQYAHGRSAIGVVLFPIFILCFILDYLLPLVYFYIIYAIEVSFSTVKPEYQLSEKMTSFLKWGFLRIGILNVAIDIAPSSDGIAVIGLLFVITFLVIEVIWVQQLSQTWATLSPKHKNTADLLRNYVYLSIACTIVGIIGGIISEGVGDFINYVIAGSIDLYLFYQLGTYYKEMSKVKL